MHFRLFRGCMDSGASKVDLVRAQTDSEYADQKAQELKAQLRESKKQLHLLKITVITSNFDALLKAHREVSPDDVDLSDRREQFWQDLEEIKNIGFGFDSYTEGQAHKALLVSMKKQVLCWDKEQAKRNPDYIRSIVCSDSTTVQNTN